MFKVAHSRPWVWDCCISAMDSLFAEKEAEKPQAVRNRAQLHWIHATTTTERSLVLSIYSCHDSTTHRLWWRYLQKESFLCLILAAYWHLTYATLIATLIFQNDWCIGTSDGSSLQIFQGMHEVFLRSCILQQTQAIIDNVPVAIWITGANIRMIIMGF